MLTVTCEDGKERIPYGVFTSPYREYAEIEKTAREKAGCYVPDIETRITADGVKAYNIRIYMEPKDADSERVPARDSDTPGMD